MTSEKLDRRKKYTRMVLKDSLLQLLKQKSFSQVTVKEICERADINRSTFYAHYRDQFELLETIEDEIVMDMQQYMNTYNLQEKEDALKMTEKLISYFAAKQEELIILLNVSDETSFERKVREVAQASIRSEWIISEQTDQQLSSYLTAFIISGSVYVLKMWLLGGMEEPPHKMAKLINNLINHGIYGTDWEMFP
ncbi:TetR/AcrR family transcriptional regulator [Oceanobacillus sp. AG]|uniref:TetR/AcrR family transcriptional regulator n=1 Tax=Oceanobacillus sp. AG TaxID=2681969 RepID=UPI0012EB8027|nr:TetR/AcrR family transcriptional regulator [Oceanobacillus sp. AG]